MLVFGELITFGCNAVGQLASVTSDNGVFYTLSDQLRSTSLLVNRAGTVKSRSYCQLASCSKLTDGAPVAPTVCSLGR